MFSFKDKTNKLTAFVSGKVIPISDVDDEVFATKMMGDGLAIIPENQIIVSPCSGKVTMVMTDSKHAVGITLKNGLQLLLHVGLDTVSLNGEGFKLFVQEGDTISEGDKLIEFDKKFIEDKAFSSITMLVVLNWDEYPKLSFTTGINAISNETVICTY